MKIFQISDLPGTITLAHHDGLDKVSGSIVYSKKKEIASPAVPERDRWSWE